MECPPTFVAQREGIGTRHAKDDKVIFDRHDNNIREPLFPFIVLEVVFVARVDIVLLAKSQGCPSSVLINKRSS